MSSFQPMRALPNTSQWNQQDCLIIFGEVFAGGYVNGLIDAAEKRGMKIITSTVGRREKDGTLRPLNEEELSQKKHQVINIPLEAGFDLSPCEDGTTPVDQLKGIKLSGWDKAEIDMEKLKQSRKAGEQRFLANLEQWIGQIRDLVQSSRHVYFAHTMAGGVPRAKIVMPAMNRVFKGFDDRYASSQEFWKSPMGRFSSMNFLEVNAKTFEHLIQATSSMREEKQQQQKQKVVYTAYGYHGTEVLVDNKCHWQSYSPYLPGFAKVEMEKIIDKYFSSGVQCCAYNCPEILTNSSSIFLGVELSLYPMLGTLEKESHDCKAIQSILNTCRDKLKPEASIEHIMKFTGDYLKSEIIKKWTDFENWPQHNGPDQMKLMRTTSTELINYHKNPDDLISHILSEVVFKSCGELMLEDAFDMKQPVWWLGHDVIARETAKRLNG